MTIHAWGIIHTLGLTRLFTRWLNLFGFMGSLHRFKRRCLSVRWGRRSSDSINLLFQFVKFLMEFHNVLDLFLKHLCPMPLLHSVIFHIANHEIFAHFFKSFDLFAIDLSSYCRNSTVNFRFIYNGYWIFSFTIFIFTRLKELAFWRLLWRWSYGT